MAEQVPQWMRDQDARALTFEAQARQRATAALRAAVATAARQISAAYLAQVGDLKTPVPDAGRQALRAAIRRIIGGLVTGGLSELPDLAGLLRTVAAEGMRLGVGTPGRPRRLRLQRSPDVDRVIRDAVRVLRADLNALRQYTGTAPLRNHGDVLSVVAKAAQATNRLDATAAWVANRAVNDGATAVADHAGVERLWSAETDACLTCLAYAGHLAKPGEPFPAGLTYGDSSTVTAPIMSPPAHFSCRCRATPWYGQDQPFGISLPLALQREAQRSVLRGESEYASRPAKLRAADRLLATGVSGLPETVKLRAALKVKAGVAAWRPAKRTPRP